MPKPRDNYAIRLNRRLHENHSKFCPVCGEIDPLLLIKDGRCVNCVSKNKKELHHILGKAFRKNKIDKEAVIPVSPNAHRLLSDWQAGHPLPDTEIPDSREFSESKFLELLAAFTELWIVLTYLKQNRAQIKDIPLVFSIMLVLLLLTKLSRLNASKLIALTTRKQNENRI